jgi:hypothetical protein
MASGLGASGNDPDERKLEDVSIVTPEGTDVSITSTVHQSTIDSERTAQFELIVTWNGSESQRLAFGNEIPFSYPNYSSDESGVVLLPADTSIERAKERTWVPKTDDTGHIPAESDLVVAELSPGETASGRWEVWADPGEAESVRPESYRFENQLGRYTELSEDGEQIDWTLALEIATSE